MSTKVLANDLDNCLINFDRKVLVTNLLDEYGGLLEEIAKTVNEFLSAEEAKGKKFEKTFLLRGVQADSSNEVITVVPEEKLKEREQKLKHAHSMLYSAETAGGSKSPPTEFVPLKHISVKLDSLVVKDVAPAASNGFTTAAIAVKEEKQPAKKTATVGAMFKKQESTSAAKKSPEKSTPKKAEPEKKPGALGAMFKKQETAGAAKKNAKTEPEKRSYTVGAMFKKQESSAAKKSPDQEKNAAKSKKGLTNFLTKKDEPEKSKSSVIKPPTPKKMNEFFIKDNAKKPKEEPPAADVSVNLFDESSSSGDEEALDKLKRELLTDDEEDKPSTSNKRRRIIDSDDEDPLPEVKVERKDVDVADEPEKSQASETFMDEDGFIVTVKAKTKKPAAVSKPNSNPTPVKIKKESPKSPTKKEAASKTLAASKTPAAKKKQGNITSFFTKK